MPIEYRVTDEQFRLFGPFPTLGAARKCARDLIGWVITDEDGLVIDSAERGPAEHTD